MRQQPLSQWWNVHRRCNELHVHMSSHVQWGHMPVQYVPTFISISFYYSVCNLLTLYCSELREYDHIRCYDRVQ